MGESSAFLFVRLRGRSGCGRLASTRPEDRATLGSDPSAAAGPNTAGEGETRRMVSSSCLVCTAGSASSGKSWGFGGKAPKPAGATRFSRSAARAWGSRSGCAGVLDAARRSSRARTGLAMGSRDRCGRPARSSSPARLTGACCRGLYAASSVSRLGRHLRRQGWSGAGLRLVLAPHAAGSALRFFFAALFLLDSGNTCQRR